jgi:hypothetical protein
MDWAIFWATFYQTHLVTLFAEWLVRNVSGDLLSSFGIFDHFNENK